MLQKQGQIEKLIKLMQNISSARTSVLSIIQRDSLRMRHIFAHHLEILFLKINCTSTVARHHVPHKIECCRKLAQLC